MEQAKYDPNATESTRRAFGELEDIKNKFLGLEKVIERKFQQFYPNWEMKFEKGFGRIIYKAKGSNRWQYTFPKE